jgi:hypothetical protein
MERLKLSNAIARKQDGATADNAHKAKAYVRRKAAITVFYPLRPSAAKASRFHLRISDLQMDPCLNTAQSTAKYADKTVEKHRRVGPL